MSIYIGSNRYKAMVGNSRADFVTKKALPYDAEVEYIHGSTRYDTGVAITADAGFDAIIAIDAYTNNAGVFGYTPDAGKVNRIFMYNNRIVLQRGAFGATGRNSIAFDTDFHHYVLNETTAQVDDSTNTSGTTADTNRNFYLFACWSTYSADQRAQSIKSLKLYHGSTLMMDLIPVRLGTHGYFWDNVSQALIGNENTNWEPGPDKT